MGKRKPMPGWLKVLLPFFIAAAVAVLFWPNFSLLYTLIKKDRELQSKIDQLEAKNVRLRERIYLLENDPVYIEKIARDELGFSKPEETIYKFDGEKTDGIHDEE